MENWINGHRFDRSTAKAPQLLGSVQCNDSTRQSGFQASRLEGITPNDLTVLLLHLRRR